MLEALFSKRDVFSRLRLTVREREREPFLKPRTALSGRGWYRSRRRKGKGTQEVKLRQLLSCKLID